MDSKKQTPDGVVKSTKGKGFNPRLTYINVSPEETSTEKLETDLTAVVKSTSNDTPKQPQRTKMFLSRANGTVKKNQLPAVQQTRKVVKMFSAASAVAAVAAPAVAASAVAAVAAPAVAAPAVAAPAAPAVASEVNPIEVMKEEVEVVKPIEVIKEDSKSIEPVEEESDKSNDQEESDESSDQEESVESSDEDDSTIDTSSDEDEDEDEDDEEQDQPQDQDQDQNQDKEEITDDEEYAYDSKPSLLPQLNIKAFYKNIESYEHESQYQTEELPSYYAQDRKGFTRFMASHYNQFALPELLNVRINPNACNDMKLQTTNYQAFIREYMRQASPYRGILVYHGLGSGKTCTSIAAAEALYGQSDKKIIIMTPISLKENFLNEIMFCGFRHYRLKNVWVKFPLNDPTMHLFAESTIGIPEKLLKSISRREPSKRVIWMPDLNKPQEESNYEDLESWERAAIREQLYGILQTKFEFIGYTGFTPKRLLDIAENDPTFFDNAVIIIDEIHNLTRLMTGKLEKYLIEGKSVQSKQYYDPITTDTWKPKQIKYSRAYLFYRLLVQAKNSKIIALSGTPIVNEPTEIGILGNILHGYFHSISAELPTTNSIQLKKASKLLENHPRVNYYTIEKAQGKSTLFFTILDEGYIKQYNTTTGQIEGIKYVGEEYATPHTIGELYNELVSQFQLKSLTLTNPKEEALPLFPPIVETFTNYFINKETLTLKSPITFIKRFSGLVSYYRGSKEELMPSVIEHPPVECPFSELALASYSEERKKEIQQQPKKKKKIYDEAALLDSTESTSYRFRSRALSNFSFPSDIKRPFPISKKELTEAMESIDVVLGDTSVELEEKVAMNEMANEMADEVAEDEMTEDEEKDESELYLTTLVKDKTTKTELLKPYKERLADALEALRERKDRIFTMDSSNPPEQQLKTYSGKFAAILERIESSPGSSLVYSQFKTVEGIGILSIVLDANGYAPIKLIGPETDLEFHEDTKKSFEENPNQLRYILYSGSESIRIRQTLINIFNMRIDKLPSKIAEFLDRLTLKETRNMHGEICRVFMITGAGAEGLSLKNVRTVHIMEPYWNKVRTDQVKGRAVRICSHSDLPYDEDPSKNQRVVEIFTYISVFSKTSQIDQTLIINDESKTTDQYILSLAETKEKISTDFLCHLKSAAVDCLLNKGENETTIGCFHEEKGSMSDFLYDPRLNKDIVLSEQEYGFEPDSFCKKEKESKQEPQESKPEPQESKQGTQESKQEPDAKPTVQSPLPDKKYSVKGKIYTGRYDPVTLKVYLYDSKVDPTFTTRLGTIITENGTQSIKMYKTPKIVPT